MTEEEAQRWLVETLGVSRETLERLEAYRRLVLEESENQNLIAKSTTDVFWARHIVDSAQLLLHADGARGGLARSWRGRGHAGDHHRLPRWTARPHGGGA